MVSRFRYDVEVVPSFAYAAVLEPEKTQPSDDEVDDRDLPVILFTVTRFNPPSREEMLDYLQEAALNVKNTFLGSGETRSAQTAQPSRLESEMAKLYESDPAALMPFIGGYFPVESLSNYTGIDFPSETDLRRNSLTFLNITHYDLNFADYKMIDALLNRDEASNRAETLERFLVPRMRKLHAWDEYVVIHPQTDSFNSVGFPFNRKDMYWKSRGAIDLLKQLHLEDPNFDSMVDSSSEMKARLAQHAVDALKYPPPENLHPFVAAYNIQLVRTFSTSRAISSHPIN